MRRHVVHVLRAALVAVIALACARCANENGEPDPPVRGLVPCNPDAGSGDPEACPPRDGGVEIGLRPQASGFRLGVGSGLGIGSGLGVGFDPGLGQGLRPEA